VRSVLAVIFFGRRRLADGTDAYDVIFSVDGLTEKQSIDIADTIASDSDRFQAAFLSELKAQYPDADDLDVLYISAEPTAPAEKPDDAFYGVLVAALVGIVLAAIAVIGLAGCGVFGDTFGFKGDDGSGFENEWLEGSDGGSSDGTTSFDRELLM